MASVYTSRFTFHPITVSIGGDLRTVNFYLISLNDQLILFDAGWKGPM
ncbi:hypothetical protein ACE1TI_16165 [Alteribacillus sp. JSM 102045]